MEYLNLFDGGPDEQEERQKIFNEVKNKYPTDAKISSCTYLESVVANVQNLIDGAMQAKTLDDSKGNQRVQNRYIDAYTWYRNEVQAMYNTKQCAAIIEDQEQKEFFDSQYDNLEKVKGLTEKTGNTTKYLVFGMLGVVIIISSVIIFKKK